MSHVLPAVLAMRSSRIKAAIEFTPEDDGSIPQSAIDRAQERIAYFARVEGIEPESIRFCPDMGSRFIYLIKETA